LRHFASSKFWRQFYQLPEITQKLARQNYKLFKKNPLHPSLHYKKVCGGKYRSVRIGINYRAIGVPVQNGGQWFWIGNHGEYDKILG